MWSDTSIGKEIDRKSLLVFGQDSNPQLPCRTLYHIATEEGEISGQHISFDNTYVNS